MQAIDDLLIVDHDLEENTTQKKQIFIHRRLRVLKKSQERKHRFNFDCTQYWQITYSSVSTTNRCFKGGEVLEEFQTDGIKINEEESWQGPTGVCVVSIRCKEVLNADQNSKLQMSLLLQRSSINNQSTEVMKTCIKALKIDLIWKIWMRDKTADFGNETKPLILKLNKTGDL